MRTVLNPLSYKRIDGLDVTGLSGEVVNELLALQALVYGGLNIGNGAQSSAAGNLDGQIVTYAFAAAAITYKVPHGLDRIPSAAILLLPGANMVVYDPLLGANWSPRNIELQSSAIGTARILVL